MLDFPSSFSVEKNDRLKLFDLIESLFHLTKHDGRLWDVSREPANRLFEIERLFQGILKDKRLCGHLPRSGLPCLPMFEVELVEECVLANG